jgi:hypothetical protein
MYSPFKSEISLLGNPYETPDKRMSIDLSMINRLGDIS